MHKLARWQPGSDQRPSQAILRARWCNHCYRGKAISITNSECASVSLGSQHAKSMRHITLLSVACPPLQYFSTLIHNRHHIRKTLLNVKRIFFFLFSLQLLSETFLIPRRIWRDVINVHTYSCKIPVILVRF